MNFEQIFKNSKQQRNYSQYSNYNSYRYSNQPHSGYEKYFRQKAFLRHVLNNRKLRAVILIALLVIIGILVSLVAILLPLIKNLVDYILENGISGLQGEAGKLLEQIWSGNK